MSSIEIQSVCFGYEKSEPLFDHYSDSFTQGAIHLLTGSNGSGKTTFLRLCIGLLQPSRGTILLSGSPLSDLTISERAKRMSISFQNPSHQLCMPSVEKEIALGLTLTDANNSGQRIETALKLCGLEQVRSSPPYDLSYSKRKMVTLAITLASIAPIVAWDEPTAGLSQSELRLFPQIVEYIRRENRTLMVVSHDLRWWLKFGDTITVFERGRNPEKRVRKDV